jgi:SAM-dependent methyltransferase
MSSAGPPESTSDAEVWEERYRSQPALWSRRPNPQLVTEAGDLPAGTALDAGSGEGADARWLASRGWQVCAVDFSGTALRRGAAQAQALGDDVAQRIRWVEADLTIWTPGAACFDLVSAQFLHFPREPRRAVFATLAAAVAPGGTLLLVGHHPSDLRTTVPRPALPELLYTAEEVVADLPAAEWEVLVAEARPRQASDPDGREVTVHDTVVRACRRAAPG